MNFQSENTTFHDTRMRDWLESLISEEMKNLPEEMFKFKTEYFLNNLEEGLSLDAKVSTLKSVEMIAVYQLEVTESSTFIERAEEVFRLFKKLHPDAGLQFLILQDSNNRRTFILTESQNAKNLIDKAALDGDWITPEIFRMNHIMIREGIWQRIT